MARAENVVVVGAGMVGVGTALALQARGYDVVLIDRTVPGSETSYGNAGIIQAEACEPYALPRGFGAVARMALKRDNAVDWDFRGLLQQASALASYWRRSAPERHGEVSRAYATLIKRATDDHARLIAGAGAKALIARQGYRVIFRDLAQFELELRKAEKWRASYNVRFVGEDQTALAAAEPALRRPLAGAIHWQDAWSCIDPGALVGAYAKYFVDLGGTLLNAELLDFEPRGARWHVHTNACSLNAANLVIALGPWSPQALAPLGYRVGMVRKRGYHQHFEQPCAGSNERLKTPVIDAAVGAAYAPMRAGLRICTGADLSIAAANRSKQLRVAQDAADRLLLLGPPIEKEAWSGVRPCMPDMLPVVGAAPLHRGLWFNFGHGHQGFTLGPTTGDLLAGLIAGDPDPAVLPLAPARQTLRLIR